MDEILRVYGYEIYNALHDSKLRGEVLLFFKNNPTEISISFVSKEMHVDYSNIKGVITGEGGKYRKDRALVYLDLLIHKKTVDGSELYIISPNGFNIANILERRHMHQINSEILP